MTSFEFDKLVECVKNSPMFQEKLKQIQLPERFELVIEPWPYGGPDSPDGSPRFFQALCFGRDTRSGNPDSNFYAYPLPLIPIMDYHKNEVVDINLPATGGNGDPLTGQTHLVKVLDHCKDAEYVPELLPGGTRKDVMPLTVVQPEGPSFSVTEGNLVQWQKWSMRVTFNPREGAVLHDIRYDGRDILYRLSMSDMVGFSLFLLYIGSIGILVLTIYSDCTLRRSAPAFPPQASLRLWRRWSWQCCEQPHARL